MQQVFIFKVLMVTALMFGSGASLASAILNQDLNNQLQNISKSLNSHLPNMVNEEIRLDKVSGFSENGKGKVIYYYRLPNIKKNPLDIDAFSKAAKSYLSTTPCRFSEMSDFYKNNVTENHRFYDKDGEYITNFSLPAKDCSEY